MRGIFVISGPSSCDLRLFERNRGNGYGEEGNDAIDDVEGLIGHIGVGGPEVQKPQSDESEGHGIGPDCPLAVLKNVAIARGKYSKEGTQKPRGCLNHVSG